MRLLAALIALGLAACTAPESVAAGGEQSTGTEVLATIDGQSITRDEVVAAAGAELAALRQQEYEILKRTVDRIVEDRLIEAAAKKAGLSVEEYLEREVGSKVADPSEEEIKAFYERVRNNRGVRGRSLEEIRGQIVDYLRSQQAMQLRQQLLDGLRQQAKVAVLLEPPRVEVAVDGNPVIGPADAPVTIVEFTDYECPYCARAHETIRRVLETYGDKVRLVVRDYPLSFHQHAQKAAEAAGCADEQGQFRAMYDKLFASQRALDVDSLKRYAQELGLDTEAFNQCLDSGQRADEVRADFEAGSRLGVSGTPAFFVNGRMLSGALPFEEFKKVIDEELARAGAAQQAAAR
ncbi:MAG: thioredoxin domain-containing protein [Acidobacteriota bacterium]